MFAGVRDFVVRHSYGKQVPWSESSLSSAIFSVSPPSASISCPKITEDEIKNKKLIGRGASSKVYRATFQGFEAAVKYIESSSFKSKLHQEVSLLWNLKHKNIVQMLGASLTQQPYFIVMELLDKPLKAWIEENKDRNRFSAEYLIDVCKIAQDIACGMSYLHSLAPPHGPIIHGDLKPDNILLDLATTVAKISDFGVSRARSMATETMHGAASSSDSQHKAVGSIPYMSPELLLASKTSDKSDVYAFSMIMFELLTGVEPWSQPVYATSPALIRHSVISGERPFADPSQSETRFGVIEGNLEFSIASSVEFAASCSLFQILIHLTEECWSARSRDRPSLSTIYQRLTDILLQLTTPTFVAASSSGPSFSHLAIDSDDSKEPEAIVFLEEKKPKSIVSKPKSVIDIELLDAKLQPLSERVRNTVKEALVSGSDVLDLRNHEITDPFDLDIISDIEYMQDIKHLILSGNRFGDDGAACILEHPNFGNIEKLEFANCKLSNDACFTIADSEILDNIVELDLSDNDLRPTGIGVLCLTDTLHNLEKWILDGNADAGANSAHSIATSPTLQNLKHLTMKNCNIGLAGEFCLEHPVYNSGQLKMPLEVEDELNARARAELTPDENGKVDCLKLLPDAISSIIRDCIASRSKVLNLHAQGVHDDQLFYISLIRELVGVEELILSQNHFWGSGVYCLSCLTPMIDGIRKLTLNHGNCGKDGLVGLCLFPGWKNLEELHVKRVFVNHLSISHLSSTPVLSNLKVLDLSENEMTDDGTDVFVASKTLFSLEDLNLSQNSFSSSSLHRLVKSPTFAKLKRLALNEVEALEDDFVRSLTQSAYMSNLTRLELNTTKITDSAVRMIATSRFIKSLVYLDLNNNHIRDPIARYISSSRNLGSLEHLDLSRTDLTTTGVDALKAFQESQPKLSINFSKLGEYERRSSGICDMHFM